MAASIPGSARIVIIGGGVIGTSIAYHLTRSGEKDVVLLEKSHLTEGATWHAAGLVGQFRSQQNLMSLMNDSVKLFDGWPKQRARKSTGTSSAASGSRKPRTAGRSCSSLIRPRRPLDSR